MNQRQVRGGADALETYMRDSLSSNPVTLDEKTISLCEAFLEQQGHAGTVALASNHVDPRSQDNLRAMENYIQYPEGSRPVTPPHMRHPFNYPSSPASSIASSPGSSHGGSPSPPQKMRSLHPYPDSPSRGVQYSNSAYTPSSLSRQR